MYNLKNIKFNVFSNTLWIVAEKSLSIFGLIFVTSLVAKYIGPENFGKLVFASSIFAVLQTVAMFGSENVIFQKTSTSVKIGQRIIETTRIIRNTIYFIMAYMLIVYLYYTVDFLTLSYSLATCVAVFFSLQDVYNIYFDAQLKSKINVICNTIGLAISLLIRYIVVELKLDVIWFCAPIISLTVIPYLIRLYIYNNNKVELRKLNKNRVRIYQKYMINVGKDLVLYSFSIVLYTKICQLFLGLKSQHDLGIYSIAVTLGTSYYFVLNAIICSYMTQVYQEKNEQRSAEMLAVLNFIVFSVSLAAFIFLYLFGHTLVEWLYGPDYKEVNNIVLYLVLVCMFSGLATVADKYIICFGGHKYLRNKTLFLVFLNLFMAYFLINFYGIYGAVTSIFITELVAGTLANYFFKNGLLFKVQLKSFYIKNILGHKLGK
ncbi:MATE family efflux transporter [Acinetobacter rathckeae]|uniref:polysaccharide biosynthesis protein n=1 Tax=Acinetobacter rathckeae TaxID=2605272 RepID=UPI0018A26F23|nr:polysaccharide biosynthesis protein [Acinetobacter rathckeae]MBF7688991.1 polysaccharide biosynthesis protein [Acinetobacter rathckeae]